MRCHTDNAYWIMRKRITCIKRKVNSSNRKIFLNSLTHDGGVYETEKTEHRSKRTCLLMGDEVVWQKNRPIRKKKSI
jgi:hypothetical protein